MRRLLFLLTLCAIAQAQSTPDCGPNSQVFTSAVSGTAFGNLGAVRCTTWTVTYFADSASDVSLQLETSPDLAGAPTGVWTAVPSGSITFGSNPSTVNTQSFFVAQTYAPWLRVNVTVFSGASVSVKVDGWRGKNAPPVGSSGGGGGSSAVQILGNSSVVSGQQAVTATAVALPSEAAKTVCVSAAIANSILVYVGPAGITTSTGFWLAAGQSTCQPLSNVNLLSVVASTTGATISWLATN